ncbi:MAG: entericidin [Pseudomonadota bacterium]
MKNLMILVAVMAALSGCGTVDGMGRDISGGAQRVGGWFN